MYDKLLQSYCSNNYSIGYIVCLYVTYPFIYVTFYVV